MGSKKKRKDLKNKTRSLDKLPIEYKRKKNKKYTNSNRLTNQLLKKNSQLKVKIEPITEDEIGTLNEAIDNDIFMFNEDAEEDFFTNEKDNKDKLHRIYNKDFPEERIVVISENNKKK